MTKKQFITVFIVITGLASINRLGSMEWTHWSIDVGVSYQFNEQLDSNPASKYPSIITFNPGAAFYLDFNDSEGGWFLRPGFWFYWGIESIYKGISRPADEAAADHMKVLGLMMDIPFGYSFIAGKTRIGLQGGPSLYFRFPLYSASLGTAVPSDFWKAYYSNGEFLYLSASTWVEFPVGQTTDLQLGFRYYHPLSVLWTQAPVRHGIQLGLYMTVNFLSPNQKRKLEEAESTQNVQ